MKCQDLHWKYYFIDSKKILKYLENCIAINLIDQKMIGKRLVCFDDSKQTIYRYSNENVL